MRRAKKALALLLVLLLGPSLSVHAFAQEAESGLPAWVKIVAPAALALAGVFAAPVGAALGFLMPPALSIVFDVLLLSPLIIATLGLYSFGLIPAILVSVPTSMFGALPSAFAGGMFGFFAGVALLGMAAVLALVFSLGGL